MLEAGGDTIAVFGCGVDQIYPAENRKLAEQIARDGLIVSEFPMAHAALSAELSRSATGSSAA